MQPKKNWIKSLEMFSLMNINTGVELSGHQNGQKWPALLGQGQSVLEWRVILNLFLSCCFLAFIIKSWSWRRESYSISNVAPPTLISFKRNALPPPAAEVSIAHEKHQMFPVTVLQYINAIKKYNVILEFNLLAYLHKNRSVHKVWIQYLR